MPTGSITQTDPKMRLPRHRHSTGYAALILAGGYLEAGDAGRFRVGPGDVLFHDRFEAHQDMFDAVRTALLDLPIDAAPGFARGKVEDPDAIVRLAERDIDAAARRLLRSVTPGGRAENDWPDRLAHDILAGGVERLAVWAAERGIRPASVSRGFRQAYGVSPQRYRLEARARQAARRIRQSPAGLAAIAAEAGFADQAHMNRAVRMVTGLPPRALRAG